ncbi:MAG: TerC family protein [Ignavibacteriales bacterium]|nr:TerC family protein [Ignavibacteriales bacterium]MBK7265827.1 TerC family protein [Ignavibacteriales bacterium]MCC6636622.1 TerC family protein [Ignavibacteriaceae bacterium]
MEWITNPESLIALLTLVALEVVLGIDNIIFISILASKLPKEKQAKARNLGLILAMVTRLLLLFSITIIMKLTDPIFSIFSNEISGRDLILITGGLFLLAKSTFEIHDKLEGEEHTAGKQVAKSFGATIVQILLLDIVFSLDSIITAVGIVSQIEIMITAVIISVIFMLIFAAPVSNFVEKHPTIKMLALSFLLMIGFTLIADGFDVHIPKGYIYFSMAFSIFVETLNLKLRSKSVKPVELHKKM